MQILAVHLEKRRHPRVKVRRRITIFTNKGKIEGESRNITVNGMFIHCKKQLRENEIYRMLIRLPQKHSIEVRGKLIWSNLDGIDPNGTFSGMGFSFVKISDADRHRLNDAVSVHLQYEQIENNLKDTVVKSLPRQKQKAKLV